MFSLSKLECRSTSGTKHLSSVLKGWPTGTKAWSGSYKTKTKMAASTLLTTTTPTTPSSFLRRVKIPPRTRTTGQTEKDPRHFLQIRKTKRISVFPVGFIAHHLVDSPVVRNGRVVGFHVAWKGTRTYPVDMAQFAIKVRVLVQVRSKSMIGRT